MEGTSHVGKVHSRDRASRHSLPYNYASHPPSSQLHQTSSRSSNGTASSTIAPRSNNSSSSNLYSPHSPQKLHPRLKHSSRTSLGSSDTNRSTRLSGLPTTDESTSAAEPRPTTQGISSYLQERLRQERRSENQRSTSSRAGSNDAMSTSTSDRFDIQGSPVRASTSDGPRPRSSSGLDATRKKAVGLRATEQKLENLLNENFNLKYELCIRREKMPKLEAQVSRLTSAVEKLQSSVDELKSQKQEVEEVNDRLVQELEKRDDAIKDAVAMIVSLEATVEKLQKERDIIRTLSAETYSQFPENDNDGDSSLPRMPSFMNDRSEKTENLRNVYIAPRASTMSFKRALDPTAQDDDATDHHKLMSTPSLSVLSESSFASVYGQRPVLDYSSSPPDRTNTAIFMDDERTVSRLSPHSGLPRVVTPTRTRRTSSGSMSASGGALGNQNATGEVTGLTEHSPLSTLQLRLLSHEHARMNDTLNAAGSGSRAAAAAVAAAVNLRVENGGPNLPAMTLEQQQQARQRAKQEKREALRRVMTDGPRDVDRAFPPTPDTISTSTLRRYDNSNDALPQHTRSRTDQADQSKHDSLGLTEVSLSRSNSSSQAASGDAVSQAVTLTAFNSRREAPEAKTAASYLESQLAVPPRPRSAGETTMSLGDGRLEKGWISDSSEDDDENINDGATVSTYDYWMREGLKPNRTFPHNPAVKSGFESGRVSPDLFAFPTAPNGTGGWSSQAMLGNLGGTAFFGAMTAPNAQALDAIGASLPTPQAGLFGSGLASPGPLSSTTVPPPPRRSSLHARTGSQPAVAARPPSRQAPVNGKLRKSPVRTRSRGNSLDDGSAQAPAPPTPSLTSPRQTAASGSNSAAADPSKRHYPPISGSQPPARRLSGLNGLFRRSTGSSDRDGSSASAPPSEVALRNAYPSPPPLPQSPNAAAFAANSNVHVSMGVPSWGLRGAELMDDVASSATPPPILRNPNQRTGSSRRGSAVAAAGLEESTDEFGSSGVPLTPQLPPALPSPTISSPQTGSTESPGGRKRGWLGRVGSLRSRAS